MESTVDKFGRIVIPKSVRDHQGLDAGTVLEIVEDGGVIVLRPRRPAPDLVERDGTLVFTGEATGDLEQALEEAVQRQREERSRHLAAWRP